MIDIRVNSEMEKNLHKPVFSGVIVTIDNGAKIPVVMASIGDKLVEVGRGMESANSFAKYGYNKIIKWCPFIKKQCKGEKCQLYINSGITGDCSINWTPQLKLNKL